MLPCYSLRETFIRIFDMRHMATVTKKLFFAYSKLLHYSFINVKTCPFAIGNGLLEVQFIESNSIVKLLTIFFPYAFLLKSCAGVLCMKRSNKA